MYVVCGFDLFPLHHSGEWRGMQSLYILNILDTESKLKTLK